MRSGNSSAPPIAVKQGAEPVDLALEFRRRLGRAIWRASYTTEEARQRYAERDQNLRQAGMRIVLAALRLLGRV